MNVIRIAALSVLLAASAAGAQAKKKQQPPPVPEPVVKVTEKDMPKTCGDQCGLIEKFCAEPCKKGAGDNKAAQKSCEASCKSLTDACHGSCKEKGRLDKQYMMERLKPPSGMKLPPGAQQAAEKEGEDHEH